MTAAPAFQFYPREFLSSRAVLLMTPEERGGYILLLCHAWLSDEPGTLPNDDVALATLSGLGDRWSACREGIARAFQVGPESWTQERMREARESQLGYQRNASAGGIARMNGLDASERRALASLASRKRWNRADISQRDASDASTASASASASAKIESTPRAHAPGKPTPEANGHGEPQADPAEVRQMVAELAQRLKADA